MSNKIYESVINKSVGRSNFNLDCEKKLSGKFGYLYPVLLQEIVPGDMFRVRSEIFVRMAPMLAPIMHRVDAYIHYFFVPNRIIWEDWEDFITAESGGTPPTFPKHSATDETGLGVGTVADYFGLPVYESGTWNASLTVDINKLPFWALWDIWNEYFRDQNLQTEVDYENASFASLSTLPTRAWEKDYFTSSLPDSQKGADLELALNINYLATSDVKTTAGGSPALGADIVMNAVQADKLTASGTGTVRVENLDPATQQITINELRRAVRLQEYYEDLMRGGTRYIEWLNVIFGVRSSDARLQRPEYLGGMQVPIQVSTVYDQSGTATGAVVAEPAGVGLGAGEEHGFQEQFEEHGHVIALLSVKPRTAYMQGKERLWDRFEPLDYYIPHLAHIGEQEVLNQEVWMDYTDGTIHTDKDGTFGYQQRNAEYKYNKDTVHGDFRTSLEFWHLARKFDSLPSLNAEFIRSNTASDRIFAVQDGTDYLWINIYHNIDAVRPMPYFSDPNL